MWIRSGMALRRRDWGARFNFSVGILGKELSAWSEGVWGERGANQLSQTGNMLGFSPFGGAFNTSPLWPSTSTPAPPFSNALEKHTRTKKPKNNLSANSALNWPLTGAT